MKIKYFHHGLWPSNSPSTTFITYNALGFIHNKIDFELITTKNSKRLTDQILKKDFDIHDGLNIHIIKAGPLKRKHLVISIFAYFYLLKSNFDILITRNLHFLPYALLLRKQKNIKVIFESHDFFTDEKLRGIAYDTSRKKLQKREKKYIPKVDAIICVSEIQKEYYKKYYPKNNFLTAVTGIKTPKTPKQKKDFFYNVAYIGSFNDKIYDFDFLFSVFDKMSEKEVNLILIGARNRNDYKFIQGLSKKYHLEKRVHIVEWITPTQLEDIKKTIDIGVVPMIINPRNQICSPLKVMEYLSVGIPVIASKLRGLENIITYEKDGFLLENKKEKWASIIDNIYQDFGKYQKLSTEALKITQRLSWDNRAKKIYDFLETKFKY